MRKAKKKQRKSKLSTCRVIVVEKHLLVIPVIYILKVVSKKNE